MPWYLYSILAMLSLSVMMLAIRKMREMGFTAKQINLFLFAIVSFGFLLLNINSLPQTISKVNFSQLLLFLLGGSLFAVFANLADMTAVGMAPNPGYSQAVKNTNVLPIAIIAVFLFHLDFTPVKFVGAVLVVIGIIFLIWKRKSERSFQVKSTSKLPWWVFSLVAIACFTGLVLTIRHVSSLGFSSKEINLFLFSFSLIGFILIGWKDLKGIQKKEGFKLFFQIVFVASFFSLLANLLDVNAIKLAPNPGFAQAIKNTNIVVITIVSYFMFRLRMLRSAEFSWKKWLGGVGLILAGIILIVI